MSKRIAEESETQPGRAVLATVRARRLATACYWAMYRELPARVHAADLRAAGWAPGETAVASVDPGGEVLLILVRAAGATGEDRWWDGLLAAERVHDALGSIWPDCRHLTLPRAAPGSDAGVCVVASGPAGVARVVCSVDGLLRRASPPPAADETLALLVPTDAPLGPERTWVARGVPLGVFAGEDCFEATLSGLGSGRAELSVGGAAAVPACGFRFALCERSPVQPGVFSVVACRRGTGFGPATGWVGALAVADGVLLLRASEAEETTEELDPALERTGR